MTEKVGFLTMGTTPPATFVHEVHHLLDAIVNNKSIAPYGATFEDGYRAAVICDAILESSRTGRRVAIPS
jgi:predicted dehydrogenase